MDIVQTRMEIVPGEIEQMRRMNLFSNDKCKEILKIRKQFERKICEISKSKQDFKDYIEYEMKLLKDLHFRKNALNISEKVSDIEHRILTRIKYLYKTASQTFPDDVALCLTYFVFCKNANFVNAASEAISSMIKNHSHNEQVWQVAAKWHAYDRKDVSTALNIICKGIAKHKTSKLLYTEVILLEIQCAVDSKLQQKPGDDLTDKQKLCVEKLQTFIREISNNIDDCEYYVKLLQNLEAYPFTDEVQNTIIEYLLKNHLTKALTWNALAQRDKKGLSKPIANQPSATSTNMKIMYINRYKQGLSQVSRSEKEELWSLYINSLIDERKEEGVETLLKEAFEQASEEGYFIETYYMQWLELVNDHEKLRIVKKGVSTFPQSSELWQIYLKLEILAHDSRCARLFEDNAHGTKILLESKHRLETVFQEGVNALKEKALPLWTGMIRYHLLSSNDDTIVAIYREGIKQPPEISDILKPQYIEWLSLVKGANYTREEYFAIAGEKPYCKELHVTMSKLESSEIEFNFDVGDKVHKLACEQFGSEDDEVWLNRVRYYVDYMRANPNTSKEEDIRQTYTDAKNSLSEVFFLNFKDKCNAMMDQVHRYLFDHCKMNKLKLPLIDDVNKIKN